MSSPHKKGLILAVSSPLAFSFFNAGVRVVSEQMSVLGLLLIRGCTGMLVIAAAARLLGAGLWPPDKGRLALIGLSGACAAVCNTFAFTMVPLYQALVILYLYPSQAVLLAAVLYGEKITKKEVLGVAVAFVGCVVLVWPGGAAGMSFQLGHLLAFCGGGFYALSFVLTSRLGDENSGGLEPIFFFLLFCAVVSPLVSLVTGIGPGVDGLPEFWRGCLVGFLGTAGQLLAFAALRFLPPYKVGVIGSMEILGGALFSLFLFRDPMGVQSIVGGVLILYAAFGFQPPRGADDPVETSGGPTANSPAKRPAGGQTTKQTPRLK
ncbi:MAG: DMT family transporter [Deltaproteobacteria bacterium]|jgi:drug/metabolite transporter (DMT)-like permease|nr:DMT family transporter [Deltaproteobacteria bacterium]